MTVKIACNSGTTLNLCTVTRWQYPEVQSSLSYPNVLGDPPTFPGIACCSGIHGFILNDTYVEKGLVSANFCDGNGFLPHLAKKSTPLFGAKGCSTLDALGFTPELCS